MQSLIYPAAFIVVLGILVFVHEFGHYAVAKLFKVRVEVFSLGFGKRLIGFRRGDTDYRVSLLPLGGYVKMAGENPMESRTGDPGEFMSHPRWQRFLIAIAGPLMNIILAISLLTGVYIVHGYEYPAFKDEPSVVGWVFEGSAAAQAGILPGDKIVRIDNVDNPTWEQTLIRAFMNPGQQLDLVIQRGDEVLHKTVAIPQPTGRDQGVDVGWMPSGPAIVSKVESGKAADQAGLQVGDEILSVNDTRVKTGNYVALNAMLQKYKDQPVVQISILRHGQELKLPVKPFYDEVEKRLRIGVSIPEAMHLEKLSFNEALRQAGTECKSKSGLIFELVGKMFERKVSIKQLDGPLGIMRVSGEAALQGWATYLQIMALISLNLAIFNLFPIPILDGGLMLMLLVESVMRRDIKQEIKERVYQAAFVFLVLFAAVVIFNDVAKTLPGLSHFK
jgi:regulator of sigma E protease